MITNLKELEKLFKLCRKQGISKFSIGEISFDVGDLPQVSGKQEPLDETDDANPYANFPAGDLTQEQIMFYSAGGLPEDDPLNQEAAT